MANALAMAPLAYGTPRGAVPADAWRYGGVHVRPVSRALPSKPRFRRGKSTSIAPVKGNGATVQTPFTTTPEALLGTLLVAGCVTIFATNSYRFFETDLFATILLIQSLPFLSAVALIWLERVNDKKLRSVATIQAAP